MRVRQIVDLSLTLDDQTQVYPGDPQPQLEVATTVQGEGYNLLHVSIGSQSGTHVDAPYHFLDDGARLDDLHLKLFFGPGVLLDLRHKGENEAITVADLVPWLPRLGPGQIVLLHTGWSRHSGTDLYYRHPHLSPEAARVLLETGARSFGTDAINIGETVLDGRPHDFPANRAILAAGGIIIENLTNLAAVTFDPWISVLPIKLGRADGAPVRAVALDLQP